MAYAGNCCDSFSTFFTCLNEVVDSLAPEKKGFFSKHTCPYFDDELRTAKKERRRAERQYRKCFSETSLDEFRAKSMEMNTMLPDKQKLFLEKHDAELRHQEKVSRT